MITRLSAGLLLAASVLLLTPCLAAPPAPAAAVRTVSTSYTISHSSNLITIKNEAGKLLLTRQAATPTLRAVLIKETATSAALPPSLLFTLEDATGLRLWSAHVPVVQEMHSAKMTWNIMGGVNSGMKFTFAFSTERQPGAVASAAEDNLPDGPVFTYVIGAGNSIVSMNGGGKTDGIAMAVVPNGATIVSSDGTNAMFHITPAGDTLEFNGTKIKMEPVKRDGKDYWSFPWNGHKIFVEGGCTISMTGDGDLTVDAPAKASKE